MSIASAVACDRAPKTMQQDSTLLSANATSADEFPSTPGDSLVYARALAADSAGTRVDTLIVTPAVVRLRLGDSLFLTDALKSVAYDQSGGQVNGSTVEYVMENSAVTEWRRGLVHGLTPGEAELTVRVGRQTPAPILPLAQDRPATRIRIQVVER